MMRDLLRARDFKRLESLLAVYADSVRADVLKEPLLMNSFVAFAIPDPALRPHLDAWVAAQSSASAHTARAAHFVAMGWEARGTKYAIETRPSHFETMDEWFERGTVDIKAALKRDSTAIAAYWFLQSIAQTSALPSVQRRLLDRALRFAPGSLLLRTRYMHSLTPRWGGSHEEMRRFAEEAQQFVGVNPQLSILRGFVAWDEGYSLWLDKDSEGALGKFTEALSYGEYWGFRVDRARVLHDLDREGAALVDYNRALRQRPQLAEALAGRALAYWYLAKKVPAQREEFEHRARVDLERAAQIDPSDEYVRWVLRAYPGIQAGAAGQ
jgi:hypothetical protein